ncbi:MAG: hypothetical protein MZV63_18920 [Marinilabiliales bacterium]|nr:hypothetical protein [Marinilabiliales bacterium]
MHCIDVKDRQRSSEEVAEEIRKLIAPMPEVINFSVLCRVRRHGCHGRRQHR